MGAFFELRLLDNPPWSDLTHLQSASEAGAHQSRIEMGCCSLRDRTLTCCRPGLCHDMSNESTCKGPIKTGHLHRVDLPSSCCFARNVKAETQTSRHHAAVSKPPPLPPSAALLDARASLFPTLLVASLFLVVRPGAPSSVLVTGSDALCS